MPNWCFNGLRVSGPAEDLAKFKNQAVGHNPWGKIPADEKPSVLNFHSLLPIPDLVLKAGYADAGFDWERKQWGCRWGACNVELIDESEDHLQYQFDTAWNPSVEFVCNVRHQWPTLTFLLDYDEPGMRFKGICKALGEHFENHCIEY